MLDKTFDLCLLGGDYKQLSDSLKSGKSCSVFGLGQTERLLACLNISDTLLYITHDLLSAKKIHEHFVEIVGDGCYLLPSGTDNLVYKDLSSHENEYQRIMTAYKLLSGHAKVIVASIDSLMGYLPRVDRFKNNILKLKLNKTYEMSEIKTAFVNMGYTNVSLVGAKGQFSARGDILDIFPINSQYPYRIEFFDNLIESIKVFDPETQSSIEVKKEVVVCPSTNLFLTTKEVELLKAKLTELETKKFVNAEEAYRFKEISSQIIAKLEMGERSFNLDILFPFIKDSLSTIFDYLPNSCLVCIDETKMVYDSLNNFCDQLKERKKMLDGRGDSLPIKEVGYLTKDQLLSGLKSMTTIAYQKITSANKFFNPECVFSFRSAPVIRYTHNKNEFYRDLQGWLFDSYKVFIMAGDERGAKRLKAELENSDVYLEIDSRAKINSNASAILPHKLSHGFVLPALRIVVVGTYDILPKKQPQSNLLTSTKSVFSMPKVGDFVVHSIHGIGVCEGVTQLTGNFGTKDFVVVNYRDNDKLYVPIDQMNLLDKYSGADSPKRLSKIGGAEFSAVKERVKKQLKEIAFSLLKLYAEREEKQGFKYNKDDDLQIEFENSFPYPETEDQLRVVSEIKNDMESGKVMDRLVCGDVGFGKTEVALRCAFKAILSGKQVAFLAPTTILSEQHYNTCLSRFSRFGVQVEVLNRFKTTSEVKDILKRLKEHKIDVLCGTHRILSKDVAFEDLGLIILDEEQKFGVEDKEKIKLNQKNVDVLTLSATPIPRTLHMSLSGIRDISVISTPPVERVPVETYVTEYTDSLIKDAIHKELMRGGQVFLVYNRVETIYAFADKIRSIVPEAKIVVGHGQLSSNELEDVVYKFYNKMADVLISTTIIENGIDLPNANTLIVIDSDMFGLSQLYQLRGRVGRANKTGYAYFTYKQNKLLSEDSYKRLAAIAEFTEFGSGFKLAMRDLELRGSGNIFGAEQHGHIEKVGYDLYCKMLNNALLEIKGKPVEQDIDTVMKISLDAYIPENYVQDSASRIMIYKTISEIKSVESEQKLLEELEDRFGKVPECVKNLVEIAYLKHLANCVGVSEVLVSPSDVKLIFNQDKNLVNSEQMANALYKYSRDCVLNFTTSPIIRFKNIRPTVKESFKMLQEFLELANLNEKNN